MDPSDEKLLEYPLLDRDAPDPLLNPVELTELDPLRDPLLEPLLPLPFPLGVRDFLGTSVVLKAFPLALVERPRSGRELLGLSGLLPERLCLESARPDLEPCSFADRPLEVRDKILLPFVDVDLE